MISEKTKLWIEVGKVFSENPNPTNVLCPECESMDLISKDIKDTTNSQMIERLVYCPKCGAKNFLRMKAKFNY